jgi:hypothetical protein
MLISILYNLALIALGFNLFILARYVLYSVSMSRSFRHIPGPKAPSLLWGEEWDLYHSSPGALYIDWHDRFGKLVKFTGAFGVRFSKYP